MFWLGLLTAFVRNGPAGAFAIRLLKTKTYSPVEQGQPQGWTWDFRVRIRTAWCSAQTGGTRDAVRAPRLPVDPVRADNRQLVKARHEVKPAGVSDLATWCSGAAAAVCPEHDARPVEPGRPRRSRRCPAAVD